METVSLRKKVSNHIKRHKGKYMTGVVCLMVGGLFGAYSYKNRKADISATTLKVLAPVNKIAERADDVVSGLNIVEHIGRNGHPGNVIYCNETKQVFKSHREATRELGIDSRDLWAYLKGIKPTARGYTFKRVGEAKHNAS